MYFSGYVLAILQEAEICFIPFFFLFKYCAWKWSHKSRLNIFVIVKTNNSLFQVHSQSRFESSLSSCFSYPSCIDRVGVDTLSAIHLQKVSKKKHPRKQANCRTPFVLYAPLGWRTLTSFYSVILREKKTYC